MPLASHRRDADTCLMMHLSHILRLPVLRVLGKPLLLRLLLLLLVIEAIFLAESFTTLMEHALRLGGSARDVFTLLGFKAPEILDLALALSLLIATYFATQDARNRGELLILATAGVHWARVICVVLMLGALGGLLSFANAGLVVPMAKYGERLTLAELRKDHVLGRIQQTPENATQPTLQTIRDTTFIATPTARQVDVQTDPTAQRRGQLFVFQPDVDGRWRVAQSRDWHVTDPAPADTHKVILQQLTVADGPYPQTDMAPPINRFSVASADFAFQMADAAPATNLIRSRSETLLTFWGSDASLLIHVAARALMVPMAALFALAALTAAGTGPLRHTALPLAALLMLSADVASRGLLTQLSSLLPTAPLLALMIVLYLGPPLAYLIWRGEALMKPERGGV